MTGKHAASRRRSRLPGLLLLGMVLAMVAGLVWLGLPTARSLLTSGSPGSAAGSRASQRLEDLERGQQGTEAWQPTTAAKPGEVSGYTNPSSALPGEPVRVFVSSKADSVDVAAYRIGAYVGGRGREIWRGKVTGERQSKPTLIDQTRTIVADWHPSTTLDTQGWPPGFYVLKLTASTGGQNAIPFVVRSPDLTGRVGLVLPTATWQAYNGWGGYSLYGKGNPRIFTERSHAVSFDRPYGGNGLGDFNYAAVGMAVTAEETGVKLGYLTDLDITDQPRLLKEARGLVSVGHDEYWSIERRQAWDRARDAGTNILITGANTMYWRVRVDPGIGGSGGSRLITSYKSASLDPLAQSDPRRATTLWSNEPGADPQDTSVGTLYECFPVDTSWTVTEPSWWGYRGTGVKDGDQFDRLVGVEADRVHDNESRPKPMRIVASQGYSCRGSYTSAQAIEYAAKSGAIVVNLNSLRWTCALNPDCTDGSMSEQTKAFAVRVTKNIIRQFARGPLATRHRVIDNVDDYALPSTSTVDADSS